MSSTYANTKKTGAVENVALYELRANGEYVRLFEPAYAFRASYARDRVHRRLLLAGVRQQLPFHSEKMIGRRLAAGSRLALTIGINKRADQQVLAQLLIRILQAQLRSGLRGAEIKTLLHGVRMDVGEGRAGRAEAKLTDVNDREVDAGG